MTEPIRLGLTGSIGMGKSTTAAMFADMGVPVWDADAVVHRLYAPGGAAVGPVSALVPAALVDGGIDRVALKHAIARDQAILARIEAVVHPLVVADRAAFLDRAAAAGAPLVVFDIPLLFETGADADMDATVTVTAPPEVQRARVLARPGMTEAQLASILSRQMPDREKRARATHVIETKTLESARSAVQAIVQHLTTRGADARDCP